MDKIVHLTELGEMMEEVKDKTNKCIGCGGQMAFDPESQSLKCTHCGRLNVFDVKYASDVKEHFNIDSIKSGVETEYLEYYCTTCGRKHVLKRGQTDLRCPSCGDRELKRVLRIDYKPDGIAPFKIDKNKATKCFFDWLKKRKMSPNDLNTVDRTRFLQGFYVPVYCFDFDTASTYSGIGINYRRNEKGERYEESRHSFSNTKRNNFRDYFEAASKIIPTISLKRLEPFSKNYYVYTSEFVYGWIGAETNIELQDGYRNMTGTVEDELYYKIKSSLRYDEVQSYKCTTIFSNVKYHYLYLPIYKGKYTYRNKDYTFYVNGETGKVIGQSPRSIWKTLGKALLIALGIFAVGALLVLLLSGD